MNTMSNDPSDPAREVQRCLSVRASSARSASFSRCFMLIFECCQLQTNIRARLRDRQRWPLCSHPIASTLPRPASLNSAPESACDWAASALGSGSILWESGAPVGRIVFIVNARHFARRIGVTIGGNSTLGLTVLKASNCRSFRNMTLQPPQAKNSVSYLTSFFIHYCDAVIAVKAAEPAALLPCNVRDTTMRES